MLLSRYLIFFLFSPFKRYGDRTPSTIFGRLFAVIWILIGITIFNMFTATITSALNKELMEKVQFSPLNQEVRPFMELRWPFMEFQWPLMWFFFFSSLTRLHQLTNFSYLLLNLVLYKFEHLIDFWFYRLEW